MENSNLSSSRPWGRRCLSAIFFRLAWLAAWSFYLLPPLRALAVFFLRAVLTAWAPRRQVALENLKRAFPQESESFREKRLKEVYRHLAQVFSEMFLLFGPIRQVLKKDVEIEGGDFLLQAQKVGKGVIVLASHIGNWEIMGAYASCAMSLPVLFVTKKLKPLFIHEATERARLRTGIRGTYEPKTLKDVLKALKGGEFVGFVIDQYAGPPVCVRVPVFGIPVGTTTAVAMVVKRTQATVVPVVNYRIPLRGWRIWFGHQKYRIIVSPPIAWQSSERGAEYEVAVNTAAYSGKIENDILAHWDQWIWTHRRFKGDLSPLDPKEWELGRARK